MDAAQLSVLLGEVCRDVGLLDDEAHGPYLLIQLVLLLRILTSASKARTHEGEGVAGLDFHSLYLLFEEFCPSRQNIEIPILASTSSASDGFRFRQLTQVRFDVANGSSTKGVSPTALLKALADDEGASGGVIRY